MKTILHVQSILENTIGFWRADTIPAVDHLMIIAGIDHRVTRVIWDMDNAEGAPYGECRCRVIVARCDGQNVTAMASADTQTPPKETTL